MATFLDTPLEISLEGIDMNDVEALKSLATRICETANSAGIFLHEGDPDRDRATIKLTRRCAKDWLKAIRKNIDAMSEADALELLPSFDTLHRVAYGMAADSEFINRHVMAAFESRIRGNKDVDPYALYRQISAGLRRRDPIYFGRPLAWQTNILDRWYKEAVSYNQEAIYDRIKKATILMETDLWVYEGAGQKAFKQNLFATLRPLYYSMATFDPKTSRALVTLLNSSRHYLAPDLLASLRTALKKAI